jgi:adenine-specific DNA-methyltransferase
MASKERRESPEEGHKGRLELTWTNKEKTLLADEDGAYTWVSPSDYRVAEVRLLDDAAEVGEVHPKTRRAKDNLLIRGDALNALCSLTELPEFSHEYLGKVKLAYLDPPFNTQQSFLHYDDALEHSVWLTMMRDRLEQIGELLAWNGSVWVHCDDYEQHRLRMVMDEVLGPNAFVATVVWQKRYSRENRAAIGSVHDYLLVYSPLGGNWRDHRNRLSRDEKTAKQYRNPNNDPRGPWRVIPMTAQGFRKNQMYEIKTPAGTIQRPPKGRCWSMVEERFKELLAEGRIYFGKDGKSAPGVIRYLDEAEGLVPWSWWPSEEVGHNDESKKEMLALFPEVEPFDTPKPEGLMQRIIEISTDPGEIVLDCFLGSGTTAAVSQKTARRWVGIERSAETLDTFAIPRLTKVVEGDDPGGISESQDWRGEGGFRILDIAPSMFEEDRGVVLLADWATNGKLAEATAAQLGYEFLEDPPFTGTKGRSLLAVVDGLLSDHVAQLLGESAGPNNRVVACGTAISESAGQVLRDIRPGSTVRKIPASILEEYRQARWSPATNGDGAKPITVDVPENGSDAKAEEVKT